MSVSTSVLIVDDESTLCDVLALYFEMEDFIVFKASNGNEAIEVLKQHPEITFVLSDVRMPDGDGVFLLNQVKQNSPAINMVMLSGFTESLESDLIKSGALALFAKPTDPRKLIDFVKSKIAK